VLCTTPDVVVMKMHDCVIGSRTGLRMMIFSAGVLAVAAGAFPADLAQSQVKLNSC
jgi:hypothetical protein